MIILFALDGSCSPQCGILSGFDGTNYVTLLVKVVVYVYVYTV